MIGYVVHINVYVHFELVHSSTLLLQNSLMMMTRHLRMNLSALRRQYLFIYDGSDVFGFPSSPSPRLPPPPNPTQDHRAGPSHHLELGRLISAGDASQVGHRNRFNRTQRESLDSRMTRSDDDTYTCRLWWIPSEKRDREREREIYSVDRDFFQTHPLALHRPSLLFSINAPSHFWGHSLLCLLSL